MRTLRVALAALCLLASAGCGDDGDSDDAGSASGADLRVTVRPGNEDGPPRTRTVRCAELGSGAAVCRELRGADLAPVPSTVACTQVFGGPATATVVGRLRGEHVRARFALTDGCEIERWRRNAALLGDPPGNPPGG